MRYRCTNSRCADYRFYGGRGVRVEFSSFEEFYAHVGPKPSPQHSIDRIDPAGNYAPGNVRWALPDVQKANRRRRRFPSEAEIERRRRFREIVSRFIDTASG